MKRGSGVYSQLKPPEISSKFSPAMDHWIIQVWKIDPALINNTDRLASTMLSIVSALGLSHVGHYSHYFDPGVSAIIVLSESHFSAHSWPEHGYIHLDLLACKAGFQQSELQAEIQNAFASEIIEIEHIHSS